MQQHLTIPGEVPAKKNRQRSFVTPSGRVGVAKDGKVRDYETLVEQLVMVERLQEMQGELEMHVEIVYNRDRDVDNAVTTIMDSLQYAGVYESDIQIVSLHVTKRKKSKDEKPCAHVRITELDEGATINS